MKRMRRYLIFLTKSDTSGTCCDYKITQKRPRSETQIEKKAINND